VVRPSTSRSQPLVKERRPHSIAYQKLIVPDGMRSMYWKFFGFPATEQEQVITKQKIVCTVCKSILSYKGNTTNLRMHLKNKHPATLQILEANPPEPKSADKKAHKRKTDHGPVYTVNMEGTVDLEPKPRGAPKKSDVDGNHEVIENVDAMAHNLFANTPTAKTRRKHLNIPEDTLKLISTELLPPYIIHSAGFMSYIEKINPGVNLPTYKQMMEELIPLKYNELRNVIINEIASVGEISLSIEEWSGIDNQIFVTISVNFLQGDKFVTRVLNTLQLNEINSVTINNTLSSWGLQQDHVVAIVTATTQGALLDAVQHWATPIPCFLHTIQVAIAACFNLPNVEVLLWKCRTIVAKYSNAGGHLSSIQTDYAKVWTSTYELLQDFSNFKSEIETTTMSDEVKLSMYDWEILQTLVSILSPFKVTIQTLQEENPGLVSIIKPLFWQLITNFLQIKEDETEFPYTVKTLLKSKLLFAYNNQSNNLLLQTATTLDPRFKQVSFSTNEERSVVDQNIKTMLSQFGDVAPTMMQMPTKKVTGMEILLGAAKQDMPSKDRGDFELSQYTSESPIAFDQNPLSWWRNAEFKYPTLIRLARTFMCIPACAIPSNKIPHAQREKFERQRANLALEVVDKLLFLNGNFV
jgi:hypothetical protein